jgi:hypothetical protein
MEFTPAAMSKQHTLAERKTRKEVILRERGEKVEKFRSELKDLIEKRIFEAATAGQFSIRIPASSFCVDLPIPEEDPSILKVRQSCSQFDWILEPLVRAGYDVKDGIDVVISWEDA